MSPLATCCASTTLFMRVRTQFQKNPKNKFQMLENFKIFLAQLKENNIKLVNIGAEDLADLDGDGDPKLGASSTTHATRPVCCARACL